MANAPRIVTVNKDDLESLVGRIPKALMDRIDHGIRWFLHLDGP